MRATGDSAGLICWGFHVNVGQQFWLTEEQLDYIT